MAQLCHGHGITLPWAWNGFAIGMERLCHGQGNYMLYACMGTNVSVKIYNNVGICKS